MLGVVEEVALAGLVGWVPVYDVEVGVIGCERGLDFGGGMAVVEDAVHVVGWSSRRTWDWRCVGGGRGSAGEMV